MSSCTVSLLVDTRESQVKELLQCAYETKQLDIADFQIFMNDDPFVMIERKTIADLAQSVKDNRYKEQKQRLLANINPNVKVIYIIEGSYSYSPNLKYSNMNNSVLTSCIINSMIRDGIFIVHTRSSADTADFIQGLFERISKDPAKYVKTEIGYNPTPNVAKRKRDNIDKDECVVMQLCCIPGISVKKARSIVQDLNVQSVNDLVTKLKESNDPQKFLHSHVNGIGKTLATTITEYLL